jgi:hypothetical protein
MDQGKARALYLIGATLLVAASQPASVPIRELRWLAAGTPVEQLDRLPAECFAPPKDPALRRSAEIGRVAFRAPLLLGGQAARVGLSCSSCHRNGRGNPDFHFPGISAAPGTADVTASLLSSHRGDGKFNPKPIPDLAGDPAKRIVSHDPAKPDLKTFIHGLITQEFDGPEPPPNVLEGVAAYVRAIDAANCGPHKVQLTAELLLADVDAALRLARSERDHATARMLIGAARSNLGRIDERFQLPGLEGDRALLAAADGELRGLQEALGSGTETRIWCGWEQSWPARKTQLRLDASHSLFSEALLKKNAQRRLSSRD